jgi:RNA polymerase sigma-70 factor (ECF subfamily)
MLKSRKRSAGRQQSDAQLIAQYALGDTTAFERLYLRHKNSVFHFLRRQTHSAEIAEDLAHDTWLAVIRQATTYRAIAQFRTWLFSIAHNRLVDHWRKNGSSPMALLDEVSQHFMQIEDKTSQGIELDDLLQNLTVLSDDQLAAVLLRIEGFSHAEIAKITESKQETVKSRLRYATKHLRNAMEVSV